MIKYLPISLKLMLVPVFCTFLATPSIAQYNFYKYSFGFGGGITLPFADTRKANYSLANQTVGEYFFTPYLSTGFEIQFGNMRGGEGDLRFSNSFILTAWSSRMQLGQFYDRYDQKSDFYWLVRGLYAGAGVGFIRNNIIGIKHGLSLRDINHDLIFPFNVGVSFYFQDFYERDRWELNFNAQFVAAMEDKMDGDLSPTSNFNDVYNYFSMGIRYKFGTMGLDKRKGRIK